MVILVASAMVSTAKLVQPYLNELADTNNAERCRGLAEYILMNTGIPSNWGEVKGEIPSAFGLASEDLQPYALDLDKVTRLNDENIYTISYRNVLAVLGTGDVSFNMRIHTLFQVSITLASSQNLGDETIYTFQASTVKSGFPVSTWLRGYAVIDGYVDKSSSQTDSEGVGMVNVTLPNMLNGVALLMVFAKMQAIPQIMSFGVYSFGHNSEDPQPNNTFLRLSPLNYMLNVSFRYPAVEISEAHVFSYSYSYSLTQTDAGNQSAEYSIPRLSEASPLILVVSGNNGSMSFAEWTAYPQLPLELGVDFDLTVKSSVVALTYVVSIESVLYELVIASRSVSPTEA
jgi:hypothetical protein